ncbi:MAG: 2OG-Fe(II) oxygenase [Myxococcota bacterium]|nr:2OG-Fe(II) oxygenase [Myxococcales bacterium]
MSRSPWDRIRPIDEDAIQRAFESAQPFRHFHIDDFLEPAFAREVAAAYPSYDEALALGREFQALNENLKIQVCDRARFPEPIARLEEALAAPEWRAALERITGIPKLLADDELVGGGMHIMGSGGRLDVHVDFNLIENRGLHRRLNILVFLNPRWQDGWGGELELWDTGVRQRGASFVPKFNRCAVFQTSEISFHGVTPLVCPDGETRNSFAAYYYTREAPAGWDGTRHTTIFRARPDEALRGHVLMPAEKAWRRVRNRLRGLVRKSPAR